ncbi:MAG: glycoside hydrolase family 2, partial [Chloroflexi bacterium]
TLRRDTWINLNGEWEFAFDRPNFDRSIIVPFAYQSELSGIGERKLHDTVWYRRRFDAPVAERVILHFGAVDYESTVWVNGREVVRHEGGHTPFSADITAVLRPGDNELVVRAHDPATDLTIPRGKQFWQEKAEGIFYTPTTGIWQTAWLEPLPHQHVASLRLWPRLEGGVLEFEIATSQPGALVELYVRLDERQVGRWRGAAGRDRLVLTEARPWSPETPTLYDLTVRLIDDAGREIDQLTSYFGLRTVATVHGRFLLNGEPYIQRLVLDQGYFPGGWYTAGSDSDLRRDIELAKSLGFNGARKHQKVEDPRWLYWADRLGFLVWAEMPNFHSHTPKAEQRLLDEFTAAIERDRDHPCVVAWVPMNETFGFQRPVREDVLASLLVRLYRRAHQLDGTRPVVSNDGWEHALTDLCTLHDYGPAAELRRRYRSLSAALEPAGRPHTPYLRGFAHRGEPVLVTEFGGVSLAAESGGYAEARDAPELVRLFREDVDALTAAGPVEGFCYTQLTDVEHERNGLLTFDRQLKVDPAILRPITQNPKQR